MSREDMAATAVKDPAIKLFGRTICLPESQFSDDSEILVLFFYYFYFLLKYALIG